MISTASVQTAIVSDLKADVDLVAALGGSDAEIREEQWMGTDYDYACVRVHITRLAPVGLPGSCEDTAFDCDFNVGYRAINPSSKPAADGLALVVSALVGQKLSGTAFVARSAVKLADAAGPIPEAENAWMGRAFFNCRLQEI
jgi:hypothetical protein